MNQFPFDIRKALLVVFVILLPLLSINIQTRPGEVPWYAKPFTSLVGILQQSTHDFSQGVRNTIELYVNLISIKRENRDLTKENTLYKTQLVELQALRLENSRLSKTLEFKAHSELKLVPAQVVGIDLFGGERQTLKLNKGEADGVGNGMAVINHDGVVGYIQSATAAAAQVLVLTDRYAVVDAVVERSRAHGIVEGTGSQICRLKYLNRADDIVEGDMIVTGGLDDVFPKGIPIGKVTKVEKKTYGISQRVELSPTVDSGRIDEVFVVLAGTLGAKN